MTLPLITACPGCTGCVIREQLSERDSFTRGEVAHLLALAFRSGASLAYEMSGDIARWAADPLVRRTARQQYEARLADIAASAERGRLRDEADRAKRDELAGARIMRTLEGPPVTREEWLADVVARQGRTSLSDCEWPDVAVPGGAEVA